MQGASWPKNNCDHIYSYFVLGPHLVHVKVLCVLVLLPYLHEIPLFRWSLNNALAIVTLFRPPGELGLWKFKTKYTTYTCDVNSHLWPAAACMKTLLYSYFSPVRINYEVMKWKDSHVMNATDYILGDALHSFTAFFWLASLPTFTPLWFPMGISEFKGRILVNRMFCP